MVHLLYKSFDSMKTGIISVLFITTNPEVNTGFGLW